MIEIYCIRGNGDKEMNEINNDLITSDLVAVKRGTYEIDRQWYFSVGNSIRVPFKKATDSTAIMDDDIVEISDRLTGITGKRKVSGFTLRGTNTDVELNLDIVKFEEYL